MPKLLNFRFPDGRYFFFLIVTILNWEDPLKNTCFRFRTAYLSGSGLKQKEEGNPIFQIYSVHEQLDWYYRMESRVIRTQ